LSAAFIGYRKEAAEDAWNKMTAWFKKYGVLS
jgi:dienelactone hydrolase